MLAKVGGPEIGAMAGLMLGAASLRVPIVIDGFIAGAAAAIAQGIRPEAAQYFIGSHNSAEPGHKLIMDHIGVTMYMDLGLCLGEGTGAALFFPLLDAATRVLSEMKPCRNWTSPFRADPFFPVSMTVITTIRSAFGFLTRLPVGPWPLQMT